MQRGKGERLSLGRKCRDIYYLLWVDLFRRPLLELGDIMLQCRRDCVCGAWVWKWGWVCRCMSRYVSVCGVSKCVLDMQVCV